MIFLEGSISQFQLSVQADFDFQPELPIDLLDSIEIAFFFEKKLFSTPSKSGIILSGIQFRKYSGTRQRSETRSAEFSNTNPRCKSFETSNPLYHTGGTNLKMVWWIIQDIQSRNIPRLIRRSMHRSQLQDRKCVHIQCFFKSLCNVSKQLRLKNQWSNWSHTNQPLCEETSPCTRGLTRRMRLHWESFSRLFTSEKVSCWGGMCSERWPILEADCSTDLRMLSGFWSKWSFAKSIRSLQFPLIEFWIEIFISTDTRWGQFLLTVKAILTELALGGSNGKITAFSAPLERSRCGWTKECSQQRTTKILQIEDNFEASQYETMRTHNRRVPFELVGKRSSHQQPKRGQKSAWSKVSQCYQWKFVGLRSERRLM